MRLGNQFKRPRRSDRSLRSKLVIGIVVAMAAGILVAMKLAGTVAAKYTVGIYIATTVTCIVLSVTMVLWFIGRENVLEQIDHGEKVSNFRLAFFFGQFWPLVFWLPAAAVVVLMILMLVDVVTLSNWLT